IYEGSEPATLAFMNALTDWHITPCMAVITATDMPTPDSALILRIAASSASDPWIQKHKEKLQETPEGCYTFHDLIVIPEPIQKEIVSRHHDSKTAGHFGESKTKCHGF
ncbi:MAG: integrase zinc binding domain-containing protein, partial [bacterium]